MKPSTRLLQLIFALAGLLAFGVSASAQQARTSNLQSIQTYNAAREVQLVGTVAKYDAASTVPPMGAHVLVQTASGQVDVHLGNSKVISANHLTLNAGDNVRIVGEPMALSDGSTYFAARIVQKGLQAVAVRNARGFPIKSASTLTPTEKEALRGVR